MSNRYEFIDACHAPIDVAEPNEEVGLDAIDPGNYALIIGEPGATALVVEGTPTELAEFVQRLTTTAAGIATGYTPSPT